MKKTLLSLLFLSVFLNAHAGTIEGSWAYNGISASLKGNTEEKYRPALNTISSSLDELFSKCGLVREGTSFLFNSDHSFSVDFQGVTIKGSWENNGGFVVLIFDESLGKLFLAGKSLYKGNELLLEFSSDRFFELTERLVKYVSEAKKSTLVFDGRRLESTVNNLQIAFRLYPAPQEKTPRR